MTTLLQLLDTRAASEPDRVALIVPGAEPLTHGQWAERSRRAASGLVDRGVKLGDRVGLVFGAADWPDYAVAFMAVLRAGAAAVPLSARLAPADLRFKLHHCDTAGVIHTGGAPDAPGWTARLDDLWGSAELPDPKPADLAQILYTSGTTGSPKGVTATHANLVWGRGGRRRPFAHSRHLVHGFPIGTNAGQQMLTNALDAHPAVVTLPWFTPDRFAALIETHRAGTVFLVPAMAIELLSARVHEEHDLSSVLLLGSAAAPLPGRVAADLCRVFPKATIANYYTSTEAAPAQTVMIYDPERPGSLGRAAAGSAVKIATADGEPLPSDTTGEVWMRSPVSRSYYGDQGSKVFQRGWVRMGDLGYLDEEGYLYLVDRESDVIKSGGFKVSTIQVEEAVYACPGVVEAAAVAIPHATLGKAVMVAVVGSVTQKDLRIFLKDRLAAHELPVKVITVDSIPRNHNGKVDKLALREAVT
ncbi:long-chain fatty acid--CoA ligase [Nonomuraea rosea]|uniref:Long-chain fatty acid--CoA ligase n=1 Tax=Nonomuraea rosea TaxID=638574 RepID=A0ABP6ZMA0_9ACTN